VTNKARQNRIRRQLLAAMGAEDGSTQAERGAA
jgi:hypothetical protein